MAAKSRTEEHERHKAASVGRVASQNEVPNYPEMGAVDDAEDQLLERILSPTNLNHAYKQVVRNGGSGGVDAMETEYLLPYLRSHKDALISSLKAGTYRPNPVRRVEIPRDNGKKRELGPTVVDRLIQQAISQVLSPLYEKEFSEGSFGFRAQSHINSGYVYAVDIDLERFFDTVSQSKLVEILSRRIKDVRVISLIHRYLRCGVKIGNKYEQSPMGVPQGGPLSPLLGNIMLNELDKELEARGRPFVRYADDGLIFNRSRRAAERIQRSITRFIEGKLHLRVNREKTSSGPVSGMKFLGYSFYRRQEEYRLRLHPKSAKRMRARLRELTSRSRTAGYAKLKSSLDQYIRGWMGYFKLVDMKSFLSSTDEWLRRRIRMCIWKWWKKPKTRVKKLKQCGIEEVRARKCASSRKAYWRMARNPTIHEAISNERLRRTGYPTLSGYYREMMS